MLSYQSSNFYPPIFDTVHIFLILLLVKLKTSINIPKLSALLHELETLGFLMMNILIFSQLPLLYCRIWFLSYNYIHSLHFDGFKIYITILDIIYELYSSNSIWSSKGKCKIQKIIANEVSQVRIIV